MQFMNTVNQHGHCVQCKVYSVHKNIYRVQPIIDWETQVVIVQLNQSSLKRGSSTQTSSKLIRLDNSFINRSSQKRSSSTQTSSKLIRLDNSFINKSSQKRSSSTQTSSKLIRLDNSFINKSSLKRSSSTQTSSKLICREIKILCWFVCLYCSIVSKILNYF